jgi:hypothetical protein
MKILLNTLILGYGFNPKILYTIYDVLTLYQWQT